MIKQINSVQELEQVLNLWSDYTDASKVIFNKGTMFLNLPELGDELLINGDFEQGATGWSLQNGWSVSGGRAHCDGSQTGLTGLFQSGIVEDTKSYFIEYGVNSVVDGEHRVVIAGVGGLFLSSRGIFKTVLTAGSASDILVIQGDIDFIGSIDYVSCREILE